MLAGPLLPTARSDTGATVVRTGGVRLFVEVGSGVGLPTLAVLVRLAPLAGAVTVSVRLVLAPTARLPRSAQMTCPPINTPPALALTNVTLAGRLSVTVTLLAAVGPRLVTLMV